MGTAGNMNVNCTSRHDVVLCPAGVLECPGSPSSGSVVPGWECLAETTVFVQETGSLFPVLNSLSALPRFDRREKISQKLLGG